MINKKFIQIYNDNLKTYLSIKNKKSNFLLFFQSFKGETIFYWIFSFINSGILLSIFSFHIIIFILCVPLNFLEYNILLTLLKKSKTKKLSKKENDIYNHIGNQKKNIKKYVFDYTLNHYKNNDLVNSLDDIISFVKNNKELNIENLFINKIFFLFERESISEHFFIKKMEYICNEFNYNNSQKRELILKMKEKINSKKDTSFDSLFKNNTYSKVKF
tara:strand:+ start:3690 stop:4340 length:651 start_codon:yes stop_codon:yes gene_type:complete